MQVKHRFAICVFCAFSLSAALLGCGGETDDEWTAKRPQTFPVNGKVLLNGQPVAGASVVFQAVSGPGATGITDEDGEFQLTTFEPGDGAIAGFFNVTVVKTEIVGADPSYWDEQSPNYGQEPPPAAQGTVLHHVPEKYNKTSTSGLVAEVKEDGKNDVTLDLQG